MKTLRIIFFSVLILTCKHEMPVEPNGETQLPQWPMFGRNLRNTSNAADDVQYYNGPSHGEIFWNWTPPNPLEVFYTSPSIGLDGNIYVASSSSANVNVDSGFVYLFHPDGTMEWRFKTAGPNYATGALGLDGTYFYPSGDDFVYAIQANGTLKWKRRFSFFSRASRPAISRANQLIVSSDSVVAALEMVAGNLLWSYRKHPTGFTAGVVLDEAGNIYTSTINSLLSLTPGGVLRWQFSVNGTGPQEIVVGYDGTLYFQISSESLLYALNPDGTIKWTFDLQTDSQNHSPGLGPDGSVYSINPLGTFYQVNSRGEAESHFELTELLGIDQFIIPTGVPIVDKHRTIFIGVRAAGDDNLYAVSKDKKILWRQVVDRPGSGFWAKPAVSPNGVIYIAGEHSLVAIK